MIEYDIPQSGERRAPCEPKRPCGWQTCQQCAFGIKFAVAIKNKQYIYCYELFSYTTVYCILQLRPRKLVFMPPGTPPLTARHLASSLYLNLHLYDSREFIHLQDKASFFFTEFAGNATFALVAVAATNGLAARGAKSSASPTHCRTLSLRVAH